MIWKIFKDKIVLDRVKDAAFYDAAVEEIASGARRSGLWAKALVEANGEERIAKLNYLKLLVLALKDEVYIADRIRETTPPHESIKQPPEPQFHGTQQEQMQRYGVSYNGRYFECGEMHFDQLNDALAYAAHKHRSKA
ncbi:MAG: hypothetical protein E6Q34_11875 [Burkholderiaceae bacterium]|nr:MAG: hypothetical protein E6Q34_11875 [Burkholderiaceae bacterium]